MVVVSSPYFGLGLKILFLERVVIGWIKVVGGCEEDGLQNTDIVSVEEGESGKIGDGHAGEINMEVDEEASRVGLWEKASGRIGDGDDDSGSC